MNREVPIGTCHRDEQPCIVDDEPRCGTHLCGADKVADSPLRCARDKKACFVGGQARCGTPECGRHSQPTNRFRRLDKPGSVYTGVGGATVKTSAPLVDGDRVFVYRDEGGFLFARRIAEFVDGRFKAIK